MHRYWTRWPIAVGVSALSVLLAGCGGGSSLTARNPYNPSDDNLACVPGADVTGAWKVVSNNKTIMPNSAQLPFFSYTQPSINASGLVVFRGRAKDSTSGSSGSGMQRGIYAADVCPTTFTIRTAADSLTAVPAPNNTGATFTDFPSLPRIDITSGVLATRGQSDPVWTLPDGTKLGTAGLYATMPAGLTTGIGLFGSVPEFSYMQVPDASTTGIRFDQFPGSPSVAGGKYLLFKGNYTDGTTPATGVYYRDMSVADSPVHTIANSSTLIPGSTTTNFGSTAPPSAANGQVVFVGLDIESAPTMGGIYLAPIADKPTLTPLVSIGTTLVPGTSAPFTQVGEGLSFDGRYVAFWGAWGSDPATQSGMHPVTVTCPTDGNKQLQAACMAGSDLDSNGQPTGTNQEWVPDNQGIFMVDSQTKTVWMIARAENGSGQRFQDFLYWTYSGAPPQPGSTGGTDAEAPHWRSSAFAAVDGSLGVIFKGSLAPQGGGSVPSSGIYGAPFSNGTVGTVFKIAEVGDSMANIDPAAPAGSTITTLGIEREALRSGWFVLTASSISPAGEGWAGIYATYFGTSFNMGATPDATGLYPVILNPAP